MTQNNEREAFEEFEDLLEQLYWEFDAERAKKSRGERDIFKGKLRFIVEKYKASISQNEQQEAVAEIVCDPMFLPALKVPLVSWKADIVKFSIGTKLYTSPPKQAIPEGEVGMTNQVNKELILPEGGLKEHSLYLVEVSYSRHNPVHQAYLRVGFLNERYRQGEDIRRMFGGYCYLWNGSYDSGSASVRDLHYMKVIKLLHTDGEQGKTL